MAQSLTFEDSIHIAATPSEVYATVSDVTRTGEWSPVCKACWWDEGDSAREGAWFTGRNETPSRVWETRSQVVTADEGRAFGWSVGPGRVIWMYTMREATLADGSLGTELTESWEFLPEGQEFFVEKFGDSATAEVAEREAAARKGIPETLAAIKRVIESGASA